MRILFLVGSIALLASFVLGDRTPQSVPTQTVQSAVLSQEKLVPLRLVAQENTYELFLLQGATAYDAMAIAQKEMGFSFQGREFPGLGFFVEEINGARQDPRTGKYWIYSINGKKAEVGISAYIVQANDIISWKYEDEE